MARPIWRGNITFGLVSIPVNLYTAEKVSEQMHLHLLDKKTHSRIHNQRVNERGTEVAWENIEHAYEFEKGKYVVVDPKSLEKTAATNYETIEISEFVPFAQINPIYFAKPYYLLPSDTGQKGYVLLHDILKRTKKVGIATVVIKTRQHLAALLPQGEYITMIILRYAKDVHAVEDFVGVDKLSKITTTAKEMQLAEQLVESMSSKWEPKQYHDDNKELLLKLIKSNIKRSKNIVTSKTTKTSRSVKTNKVSSDEKIVDFMSLLKESVAKKEKHPPTKGGDKKWHKKH